MKKLIKNYTNHIIKNYFDILIQYCIKHKNIFNKYLIRSKYSKYILIYLLNRHKYRKISKVINIFKNNIKIIKINNELLDSI